VGLSKLKKVYMENNICIRKNFLNTSEIATFPLNIPSNCSTDATPSVNGNTSVTTNVNATGNEVASEKIKKIEAAVLTLKDENLKSKAQIGNMNQEIGVMKLKIVKTDAKMKQLGEVLSGN
jgi:hypothetical protein